MENDIEFKRDVNKMHDRIKLMRQEVSITDKFIDNYFSSYHPGYDRRQRNLSFIEHMTDTLKEINESMEEILHRKNYDMLDAIEMDTLMANAETISTAFKTIYPQILKVCTK